MLTACSLPAAAVFVLAALSAVEVNAVSPIPLNKEKCCPLTTQYMCNTLGSVGSATRTPICCKDGTWGCTRPGAGGPSACDPEVGLNSNPACADGKLPSENSFMIASFDGSFSWPGATLRVRAGSNSLTMGGGYTPFVWREGRLANFYDKNRCLVAMGSKLRFGPCKGATIWETIPVKPKEMWKKKGDGEPVVNVVTGEGSKRKCLELRNGTPPGGEWTRWAVVVKCNGKQEQKWFLWNGNEALA